MAELRVLHFNADRGREATTMLEKEFLESYRYGIAIVEEPYQNFQQDARYNRHRHGQVDKAEV